MTRFYRLSKPFIIFSAIAYIFVAAAAHSAENWPDGASNCQGGTTDFKRDCTTTYKYAARDTKTDAIITVHRHKGMNYTKSELKKAFKLQDIAPDKWMLKNPANVKFTGLRSATGDVLLQTVYEDIYPLSATHSVVKLRNDELKIAEHGTHKLSELPLQNGSWKVFSVYDKTSELNTYIFTVSVPDPDSGRDLATFTPLLADLSLGEPVKYIKTMKNSGYDVWGANYVLYAIDRTSRKARAALFSASNQLLDHEAEMFGVNYGEYKNAGRGGFEKAKSLVALIGPSPAFVGLDEEELFWPYDVEGKVLPRPETVAGMVPVNHQVIVYGDAHRKLYDSWLIVYPDGAEYDYALATFNNSSKAADVAAELDRFQRLDDVYFARGSTSDQYFYAVKPKAISGAEQPWHAYSLSTAPGRDYLAFFKGDKFDSEYRGATARAAIEELVKARNIRWAEAAKQSAAFDAALIAKRKADWIRLYSWTNPVTPAAECASVYRGLQAHVNNVSSTRHLQTELLWMGKYVKNGYKPCDKPPNVPSGGPTYTLQQGFQDMGKAIACTRKEERCVSDGQYQRCRMVTVNTC